MNKKGGFSQLAVILIAVGIVIVGGGLYFALKAPQVSAPEQGITTLSEPCKDFGALSDYVLKAIVPPDSQNIIQMNPYVINSFHWKRNREEPFISYPIINGTNFLYGGENHNRSSSFIASTTQQDSYNVSQTINSEALNLGLTADPLNTLSFQLFTDQYLQTFGFKNGDDLYSILIKAYVGHQAPSQGTITVTCGRAIDQYDKIYNALGLKTDLTVQDPYDNDYVTIAAVSPDSTVYALLGSSNHIKVANYYYFDGTTAELVSSDSYPTQCAPLESQKVGLGMRCVDTNYNQRTVIY